MWGSFFIFLIPPKREVLLGQTSLVRYFIISEKIFKLSNVPQMSILQKLRDPSGVFSKITQVLYFLTGK